MLLHLSRTRSWGLYRLTARLDLSPEERQAIYANGIHRYEIFHDPKRDELLDRAEAADKRLRALPWFPPNNQLAATVGKEWLESTRSLVLVIRALACFRLTVKHLVNGVTISNFDLAAIRQVEAAITDTVDHLQAAVAAAIAFEQKHEDVLAPGEDDDRTPPPAWPPRRQRW